MSNRSQSYVSVKNSSAAVLSAGQFFQGQSDSVEEYSAVSVSVFTDVAGVIVLEASHDGNNWFTVRSFEVLGEAARPFDYVGPITEKYLRVRYTNGAADQSTFSLQVIYHDSKSKDLTYSLDDEVFGGQSSAALVRAVLTGETVGGRFKNVGIDADGHLQAAIHAPRSAFGEVMAVAPLPLVQMLSIYGVKASEHLTVQNGDGTVTVDDDRVFVVSSGTGASSGASIHSRKILRDRPGQGCHTRLTALFSKPEVGVSTKAGSFTEENGFAFGYKDADFCIFHLRDGRLELRELTITDPADAGETAAVVLDGVTFNVPLTGGGSAAQDAYELAEFSYDGWSAESAGSVVRFVSTVAEPKIFSFSYTTSTGAGTFVQTRAGKYADEVTYTKENWNRDPMDGTGGSGMVLDPQKFNVYSFQYQWLGAGTIEFFVEEPVNGDTILVHRILYPNNNTVPSISEPNMRVGFESTASQSVAGTYVKGICAAGFVQGIRAFLKTPRAHSVTKSGITDAALVNVLTLRNNTSGPVYPNFSEIFPQAINLATFGNKIVQFFVLLNPDVAGFPVFVDADVNDSIAAYDSVGTTVTGGITIDSSVLQPNGRGSISLTEKNLSLQPGDRLVVAAISAAGGTADAAAAISWVED